MAKSIEGKAVEVLGNTLMDKRFSYSEFARQMIHETNPDVHKSFFTLLLAYVRYLSIYDQYAHYPNLIVEEATLAGIIQETLDTEGM